MNSRYRLVSWQVVWRNVIKACTLLSLISCGALWSRFPVPTQTEMLSLLRSYPHASNVNVMSHKRRANSGFTDYDITFTTSDSKENVISYYDKLLTERGFRKSHDETSGFSSAADGYYFINSCPLHALSLTVRPNGQVLIDYGNALCI